ncbi:hypothetical protein AB1Y20_019593 [Prymnesium parvum]|uniref:Tubulin--tyrosine ligase-like protein 9 n=1 Tax=Prymnesium parvum TaxID=97485 RepID=A0AB34JWC1_PRYPA
MRRDERKPSHVRFRTTFRNCVYDLLRSRGYTETESDTEWELAWVDKDWIREHFDGQYLSDAQRINHFRNHYELTRKDNLVKNLKRTQRHLLREGRDDEAAAYDFFPGTYVLPADYGLFVEEFKTHPPGSIWIMKPTGSAQGKGIFLFNKLSQVTDWKKDYKWKGDKEKEVAAYVVQRYIENPQLIGGKKFDLRLYVLVTSYSPLTVYIYRAGFCRFSGYRYNTHAKNLGDTYVHLTNAAIQKTAPGYDASAGCKWPLTAYKLYMIAKYGVQTTDKMFDAVEELVVNTLLSVQKVMINDKHCFEMYGYDILVDDTLKPWLIEVNASPSISADTMQDYDLKFGLLDDVFTVVDMETKLGGAVEPTLPLSIFATPAVRGFGEAGLMDADDDLHGLQSVLVARTSSMAKVWACMCVLGR